MVIWGARKPIRRAPYVSNASTKNGVNGTHSVSDAIMDLSRFISGGVKHKGVFNDLMTRRASVHLSQALTSRQADLRWLLSPCKSFLACTWRQKAALRR